jgi:large subunit ribosomal protein L6
MSRVGKKPIPLPAGVKVTCDGVIKVEGPKGKLEVPLPEGVRLEQNGAVLEIKRDHDSYAAVHGLTRALTANAVTGVGEP